MTFKSLTLKDKEIWASYLKMLPLELQDIYFTPEYYQLHEENGDGTAVCLIYSNGTDIIIYPFLINPIKQLGYSLEKEYYDIQGAYGYNGFLTNNKTLSFINSFHNIFKQYCFDENIIAEFTRFHPLIRNQEISLPETTVLFNRKTVYIDLTDSFDEIWKNEFSSKNRNMIRKALNANVSIEIGSINDYFAFQQLYIQTMLRLNADPYYFFNEKYFRNLNDLLGENQKLLLAKYDNKIVAGSILLLYGNYAHYHLSARDNDYASLAANNLILDFALKFAKTKGCKFFHLGGGSSTSENDRLFLFKSDFSKKYLDFFIGKKIHDEKIYNNIIEQWENKHTNEKNSNVLLKYRSRTNE